MTELIFAAHGQELVAQELDRNGYVTHTRPITPRNGYDLNSAADRRDLARQILSEVLGWRLANRLEESFQREVIDALARDGRDWSILASDVERWLSARHSIGVAKAREMVIGH